MLPHNLDPRYVLYVCLLQLRLTYDSKAVQDLGRGYWKSNTMGPGGRSAIPTLVLMKLKWSATCWDSKTRSNIFLHWFVSV